jgi:hypothetical protein
MKFGVTAIICLALLACASTAQAAQRYAAPEGKGGEPCAQAAPCSLKDAIGGANSEDEVIVGSGEYTVPTPIFSGAKNVYVHGDLGGAMPKINASVVGSPINFAESARFAYLEILNTAGTTAYGFSCRPGGRIERVRVLALSATNALGVFQSEGCLVRDSVIRSQGTNAVGILNAGTTGAVAVDRNLTVLASGTESIGLSAVNSGTTAIDVKDSIFAGDLLDLKVAANAKAFVGNSNFDSSKVEPEGQMIDLGGNQNGAPLFVDAAKGDYREAVSSPTIDGGVDDQLGALDLGGNARVIGAAVDIGAFEFAPTPPPPPSPSPAAGQIQSLALAPSTFRPAQSGEAVISAAKTARAPIGTTVTYSLSATATTKFSVERKTSGRKVGRRCVKQTKSNKSKAKCALLKPVSGGFTHSGAAGLNSFKFTGRVGNRALAPGRYELVASAGGGVKRAPFAIVK